MQVAQVVWLVLIVLFVVLETVTAYLVSIWFCAGALVALVVALLFPGAVVAQAAAFVVVSAVMLAALRPVTQRLVGERRVRTNADANVGKLAQVTADIGPDRFGRVKLESLEWTAKSDTALPAGAWCKVVAIEGVKLVVVPAEHSGT